MNAKKVASMQNRAGFGLAETVMAIMVGTVAVVGLASILAATARVQGLTSSRLEMLAVSETKLDEIRRWATTETVDTLRLNPGGSLTSDITNYSETRTSVRGRQYNLRWQITTGMNGLREVTLRVAPASQALTELRWLEIGTRMWVE